MRAWAPLALALGGLGAIALAAVVGAPALGVAGALAVLAGIILAVVERADGDED